MRMLMRTLSGWMTYATLRATHLSVGRRQVLPLAGGLVIVTLGVVAWRGSTPPTASPGVPRVTLDLPPTPSVASAATRPAEAEPPRVAPRSGVQQMEPAADLVNPFSGRTLREEQEAREMVQRAQSDQRRLELTKLAVEIARQEQELARVRKETQELLRPPSRPTARRVPTIPPAQPLAIASQSALVLYRGVRITTWPGSTLGAWTVEAVFPDGIAIRHQERRAFLPLAFPSRRAH
jgi:hypothetical protein